MVIMLGGHNQPNFQSVRPLSELTMSIRVRRHLRCLFWLLYIFDKDCSLRTGIPPTIADEYCDLTLPDGYINHQFGTMAYDPNLAAPLGAYLPGDLRLNILKGKICRKLCTSDTLKKSDAELLRDIRELDDELESWRMSIPLAFRPSLSIPQRARGEQDMCKEQNMKRIMLCLEYHYIMSSLHLISGRCRAFEVEGSSPILPDMDEGLKSSFLISVQAARSTLVYLGSVSNEIADEAFW